MAERRGARIRATAPLTSRTARGRALAAGALLALAACGPVVTDHGYVPPEAELSLLVPGVDDRESVARIVGRPSSSGLLTDGGFYYVADTRRTIGPAEPRIVDREVVSISFAPDGTVANIERFGLEDGNVVALSRRVTDTNVAGVGFLRQLFGNLGNLDVPGLLN